MHVVKSWPQFYNAIVEGTRRHELRRNDRKYQVGDVLELHEYEPARAAYTGRVTCVVVTSMTSAETPCAVSDVGLHPDFCILSVEVITDAGDRDCGDARLARTVTV
jgi:hypothetical protein